ncbi:hypothetical protein RchiOBHm_Chr7g0230581 [Rosa chinensis]|uniref:Uncharacterized protein n=1 Tax=Rosa chinensis TaxID=74649 RepID=A0A2P6PFF6_ROSCH|nr:hypothetical protein RchiOBHm_Chr7g0230581 [Rosa chinensis]
MNHVKNLISNTSSLLNTQKNCTTQFSFRIHSRQRPKIIASAVPVALHHLLHRRSPPPTPSLERNSLAWEVKVEWVRWIFQNLLAWEVKVEWVG